jgi:hypothetical protein
MLEAKPDTAFWNVDAMRSHELGDEAVAAAAAAVEATGAAEGAAAAEQLYAVNGKEAGTGASRSMRSEDTAGEEAQGEPGGPGPSWTVRP